LKLTFNYPAIKLGRQLNTVKKAFLLQSGTVLCVLQDYEEFYQNHKPNQYQTEVEEKYKELDKMFQDFQTEKVLLTEEMKRKREDEIIEREKVVKELQMKYFGRDGMLFKKREELVKPIQDQVFNAVKEMATEGGYAIIFDAAGAANMLYTNPRYDKSDEVIQKLGYN